MESNTTCYLFWNNLHSLVFSEQVATHPLLCETLLNMFPTSHEAPSIIRPQLVQFLNRCKLDINKSISALAAYESILRNYGSHLPQLNEEYLQLCTPLLDQLFQTNKLKLITAVKFLRFLVRLDERDANKYLKENHYIDQFLKFNISRKQEGVLEGLLRETVIAIIKNVTLA